MPQTLDKVGATGYVSAEGLAGIVLLRCEGNEYRFMRDTPEAEGWRANLLKPVGTFHFIVPR